MNKYVSVTVASGSAATDLLCHCVLLSRRMEVVVYRTQLVLGLI